MFLKKYNLEIITFISGLLVMVLELVGSRLVAPYLGTSIFVWTSLIGTILLSLSIGYFLGGRLADKHPEFSRLSFLLIVASILSTTILILEIFVPLIVLLPFDLRIITVIVAIMLFTPVTIILGMVSPYVARIKISSVTSSGAAIGTLYSLSTIGSIIGTFLGGFILISYFGTVTIMIGISAMLFCLYLFSVLTNPKKTVHYKLIIVFIFLFIAQILVANLDRNVVADIDSTYNRWLVEDHIDPQSSRIIRYLKNNIFGIQSAMALDNPTELVIPYLKEFDTAAKLRPNFTTALLIGAGSYTYPTHFIVTYPQKKLDIVEIDPKLRTIAETFFSFKPTENIIIAEEDGRVFLNNNTKKYDVIFLDAFSSQLSIPHHLTTIEAVEKIHDSLSENGLVVANIISPLKGNSTDFLHAEVLTYKKVFTYVTLKQVLPNLPKERIQNVILFASDSPINEGAELAVTPTNAERLILTDDFAPIERYTEAMLSESYENALH
jgi:MFS family permease